MKYLPTPHFRGRSAVCVRLDSSKCVDVTASHYVDQSTSVVRAFREAGFSILSITDHDALAVLNLIRHADEGPGRVFLNPFALTTR